MNKKQKEVLGLIDRVREYSESVLGIPVNAFREFTEGNDSYYWVYASRKDRLESVIESLGGHPFYYFEDEGKANEKVEEMKKDYDVFMFQGEAASGNTQITKDFMDARLGRKVNLLIHESIHNFFSDKKIKLPYDLNEAIATHIGHWGAWDFCKSYHPKTSKEAWHTLNWFSDYAKLICAYTDMLNLYYEKSPTHSREHIFKSFEEDYNLVCANNCKSKGEYEINNAYFIRNIDYCITLPIIEEYFKDQRKTVKGIFGTTKKKREEKIEHLIKARNKLFKSKGT